jgi:phage minor structural protein
MANLSVPQVFDKQMHRLAFLDNATSVGYDLPINALWSANFTLPADDPKNEYCQPFNYVEIFDGETRIDLFRIVGVDFTRSDSISTTYTCEHCLATLLDDVIFQYDQIGGATTKTYQVLQYLLGKQTTQNWVMSECDFERKFEYNFENDNLLAAVFSVPQCFDAEYIWQWDTTVYPWALSLKALPTEISAEIRYGKNLAGIHKTTDCTTVVNRIFPLGYGEGVNQLTISEVNSGLPYVEDGLSQQRYGLHQSILVDSRYQVAENLMDYAKQNLMQLAEPYVSYEVSAIDLFRLQNDDYGHFRTGAKVKVIDQEDNITLTTTVVEVKKDDLRSDPAAITVTLANKEQSVASSISDLENRTLINETYSQGATNVNVQNFADNADANYPASFKMYIPENAVRINQVLLNVQLEAFRGYSKSVSSTKIDLTATNTSEAQGSTSSSTVLKAENISPSSDEAVNAVHNHGIPAGTRIIIGSYDGTPTGSVGWTPSGAHNHGAHTHTFNLPSHSHKITMPSHNHNMEYGIYTGSTADSITVAVDGNTLPTITDYNNINLVNYLSTNDTGKITRGWHTIEITPNKQSRIVAALFLQIFTNSRGGGDY